MSEEENYSAYKRFWSRTSWCKKAEKFHEEEASERKQTLCPVIAIKKQGSHLNSQSEHANPTDDKSRIYQNRFSVDDCVNFLYRVTIGIFICTPRPEKEVIRFEATLIFIDSTDPQALALNNQASTITYINLRSIFYTISISSFTLCLGWCNY